ncbi:MAG: flagellar export protein FliJ [Nitrospinaceae bacterium]|nr:flagellar export protein FliJ [Nitrospinaceae bacterium]
MAFRFETLLRLRKNQENLEQRSLAAHQNQLRARQAELAALETSGESHREGMHQRLREPVTARTLNLYHQYLESLGGRLRQQAQVVSEVVEKTEAQRQKLVASMKKRRVLEILKEREILGRRRKMLKEEIALLDEISSSHWMAKNR